MRCALCAAALVGCGGGGDSGSANTGTQSGASNPTIPSADIDGIWVGSTSTGLSTLLFSVGDSTYGFQAGGSTLYWFTGWNYRSSGNTVAFDSNLHPNPYLSYGTSVAGSISAELTPGSAPQLSLSFQPGGFAGTASPLVATTLLPPAANVAVVADVRDYSGPFTLTTGSLANGVLTITPTSESSANVSGVGVEGCSVIGTLSRPRTDRNVWKFTLTETACTDSQRNLRDLHGLGVLYKSGVTLNLSLVGDDGYALSILQSSR